MAAVLIHRNTEEAAKAIGVGYKTLLRWQQIPEFQAALRKAQHEALAQTTARLLQGAPAAASMLMKVMLDTATPASTKVRAAENILNHAERVVELQEIEARLEKLEQSAD